MDYLELIVTFNQKYGKKWYVIHDVIFFRFLVATLIMVTISIYLLANHNFNKEAIYQAIGDRYKDYIVGVYNTFEDTYVIDTEPAEVTVEPGNDNKIDKFVKSLNTSASPAPVVQAPRYSGLLSDAEDFEVLSYNAEPVAPPSRFFARSNQRRSGDISSVRDNLLGDRNYKIYRKAGLYLDIPQYLLEEKPNFVYRDQEDVLKVIYSKSSIIESCYQKAARMNLVNAGFVKVEFQIDPNGIVLPASIRILDSTIRNKQVEQCIKKNIRRWRSFEKLENSRGIAHVVHKFVFK